MVGGCMVLGIVAWWPARCRPWPELSSLGLGSVLSQRPCGHCTCIMELSSARIGCPLERHCGRVATSHGRSLAPCERVACFVAKRPCGLSHTLGLTALCDRTPALSADVLAVWPSIELSGAQLRANGGARCRSEPTRSPAEPWGTRRCVAAPRSAPRLWMRWPIRGLGLAHERPVYSVAVMPPRRQLCSRCTPKSLLCAGSSFLTGAVWRQVMRTSWCFC